MGHARRRAALEARPAVPAVTLPDTCCAPSADGNAVLSTVPTLRRRGGRRPAVRPAARLVQIPAGSYLAGAEDADARADDGEGPVRNLSVDAFRIAPHAVTNVQFATFVKATGYVTQAERQGWSFVVVPFLTRRQAAAHVAQVVAETPWWGQMPGAAWRTPLGPGSGIGDLSDHPVVHVSHDDALAYCDWAALRLPTENEWEYAARGGLVGQRYPWGNDSLRRGRHRCNIWQGPFPAHNTAEDGWLATAPVRAYEPNGYGLFNMVGNVWEWSADWWSPRAFDPDRPADSRSGARVIRGGSFLCHDSYCNRYRVSARSSNTPDSTTANMGFRCAADV